MLEITGLDPDVFRDATEIKYPDSKYEVKIKEGMVFFFALGIKNSGWTTYMKKMADKYTAIGPSCHSIFRDYDGSLTLRRLKAPLFQYFLSFSIG